VTSKTNEPAVLYKLCQQLIKTEDIGNMLKRQLRRSQKIPSIKYTSRRLPMYLSTVSEAAYNLTSQSPKGLGTRRSGAPEWLQHFLQRLLSYLFFPPLSTAHREGSKDWNCSRLERLTARLLKLLFLSSHCLLTSSWVKGFVFNWPWFGAV